MSARSSSSAATAPDARPAASALSGISDGRLGAALAVAAAGAVLGAAGGSLDVVEQAHPAYLSWPLLVVLAVLPVAIAIAFVVRGRPGAAAGVLVGAGVISLGRLSLDAQIAIDSSLAARPELFVPLPFEAEPAWMGLSLLLAGHLLAVLAGYVALSVSHAVPGDGRVSERYRRVMFFIAIFFGCQFSAGLLVTPFTSDDANLLGRSVFDGPPAALFGALLLAAAVPLAAALALTARSWDVTTGVLLGLALTGTAVMLPIAVAGVQPWIHLHWGPLISLLGVAALAVISALPPEWVTDAVRWFLALWSRVRPSWRVLYPVMGALAVLAGGCAVAGARAPLVTVAGSGTVPPNPAQLLLLPAGVVVGAFGLAMFVPAVAGLVRPVLSVAWVSVPLAGASALELPLAAAELPVATETGAGVVLIGCAMVAAGLVVVLSLVAGVIEREDVDEHAVGAMALWPATLAGALAVGAFGMPVVTAPRYTGSGLFWSLDITSGALLAALVAVIGVVAIVGRSRPARAIALLLGAMLVVGVRLLELQLVSGQVADATARTGAWFAIGCMAALAATAVIAGRSTRRAAHR